MRTRRSVADWGRRALLLALLALAAAGCSRSPSEQALRQRLDALQAAGEASNVSAFMEILDSDFAGNGTEFDRAGMERMLRLIALRHRNIGVTRVSTEIELQGERAVVRMQVLLTGGSGGLLPDTGRLLDTESSWRFDGSEWKLLGARWTSKG